MTPRIVIATILIVPALTVTGFAQTTGELAVRLFTELDRNRDGKVTAQEFGFMRGIDYGRLDRNGDGIVDRREFVDLRSPANAVSARARRLRRLRTRRFAELDKDRDGRIARQEYVAFGRRLFRRLDRNGDGVVVLNEVAPAAGTKTAKKAQPKPRPVPRPDGARPPGRIATARPGGRKSIFGQLDRDGNGAISYAELTLARRGVFARLDGNSDGRLGRKEFAATAGPRARRFTELDANRDGKISLQEYLADGRARFLAADRNKNGRLSPAEFRSAAGG